MESRARYVALDFEPGFGSNYSNLLLGRTIQLSNLLNCAVPTFRLVCSYPRITETVRKMQKQISAALVPKGGKEPIKEEAAEQSATPEITGGYSGSAANGMLE